jgi:hypothetical protein
MHGSTKGQLDERQKRHEASGLGHTAAAAIRQVASVLLRPRPGAPRGTHHLHRPHGRRTLASHHNGDPDGTEYASTGVSPQVPESWRSVADKTGVKLETVAGLYFSDRLSALFGPDGKLRDAAELRSAEAAGTLGVGPTNEQRQLELMDKRWPKKAFDTTTKAVSTQKSQMSRRREMNTVTKSAGLVAIRLKVNMLGLFHGLDSPQRGDVVEVESFDAAGYLRMGTPSRPVTGYSVIRTSLTGQQPRISNRVICTAGNRIPLNHTRTGRRCSRHKSLCLQSNRLGSCFQQRRRDGWPGGRRPRVPFRWHTLRRLRSECLCPYLAVRRETFDRRPKTALALAQR